MPHLQQKNVGTFVIGEIIKDTPANLWKNLNELSGLSEQEFFDYFYGTKTGLALELGYTKFFEVPNDLKLIFPVFIPPQSFYYFDETVGHLFCCFINLLYGISPKLSGVYSYVVLFGICFVQNHCNSTLSNLLL